VIGDPFAACQFQNLLLIQRRNHGEVEAVQVLLHRQTRLLDASLQRIRLTGRDFQFCQSQQILFERLIRRRRFASQLLEFASDGWQSQLPQIGFQQQHVAVRSRW